MYCMSETDHTRRFASSQLGVKHDSIIWIDTSSNIIYNSVSHLVIGYWWEGVSVKKHNRSRGHNSLLVKTQYWLANLASPVASDSRTRIPAYLVSLGNSMKKNDPGDEILSNDVSTWNGHKLRT